MMNIVIIIYDDLTIPLWWNIIKNNNNQLPQKVSPLPPDLGHWVPITDDEHSDHHLWWPDHTFVMKLHQNYSNQSLSKSVTTAPRFGTWGPYSRWWTLWSSFMMTSPYLCDETSPKTTVTNCLKKCHHCTQIWHMGSYSRWWTLWS